RRGIRRTSPRYGLFLILRTARADLATNRGATATSDARHVARSGVPPSSSPIPGVCELVFPPWSRFPALTLATRQLTLLGSPARTPPAVVPATARNRTRPPRGGRVIPPPALPQSAGRGQNTAQTELECLP